MIKEIVSEKKTVFGNEESVNYLVEKKDDLVLFIKKNIGEWRRNKTVVTMTHDVLGILFVVAHDYEITKNGRCEFYFDPLNESSIKVAKTDSENIFILENAILDDKAYNYTPYQAFASSVNISLRKQENLKSKSRG